MNVFFIGRGSLLFKAVKYTLDNSINISGVSCLPDDNLLPRFKNFNLRIFETINPNHDLLNFLSSKEVDIVFSINNKFILNDALLSSGPRFYNIHSGLIQSYRGIAEVCMIIALSRCEEEYGVTLHELLPNQEVDQGPVLEQIRFSLIKSHKFSDILLKSLNAAEVIFQNSLLEITTGSSYKKNIKPSQELYTYKNIQENIQNVDSKRLKYISDLGQFTGFFPKLNSYLNPIK